MKVKYLKVGKLYIVYRTHSQQIVYSNKSKNNCYEFIFNQMSYV